MHLIVASMVVAALGAVFFYVKKNKAKVETGVTLDLSEAKAAIATDATKVEAVVVTDASKVETEVKAKL